jgi:hypothetical protein
LRRKRSHNGDAIGIRNPNPILNTHAYEVEFADGSLETYHTNLIAENIYSQVDDKGRSFVLLSKIVDHHKEPTAIAIEDAYITLKSGQHRLKPTTKGWKLEVAWKDGSSTSWVLLKDLKELFPIELAEYAMSNKARRQACFRLVGADCATGTQLCCCKGKEILETLTQVWYLVTKTCKQSAEV